MPNSYLKAHPLRKPQGKSSHSLPDQTNAHPEFLLSFKILSLGMQVTAAKSSMQLSFFLVAFNLRLLSGDPHGASAAIGHVASRAIWSYNCVGWGCSGGGPNSTSPPSTRFLVSYLCGRARCSNFWVLWESQALQPIPFFLPGYTDRIPLA